MGLHLDHKLVPDKAWMHPGFHLDHKLVPDKAWFLAGLHWDYYFVPGKTMIRADIHWVDLKLSRPMISTSVTEQQFVMVHVCVFILNRNASKNVCDVELLLRRMVKHNCVLTVRNVFGGPVAHKFPQHGTP